MKLFFLSRENVMLAKAEVEALHGKGTLNGNLLLVKTNEISPRLAQTRFITDVVLECNSKEIEGKIRKFSWNKVVKGSFALNFIKDNERSHSLERKYGGMIYDLLKNPEVDLENPKTKLVAVENKNKIYIGIEKWVNKEDFDSRNPSNIPGNHPISMQPKLARVCVNLTGSKTKIYDPFCGTGGFLIEAGVMNIFPIGSDVDINMIELSKKNLKHHGIKKYELFHQDALSISKKYSYIVSDLPYGKNSRKVGDHLYADFLSKLRKIVTKRAVLVFPKRMDALIKKNKLKIMGRFSVYVHGSLTREIYVIEPYE